VPGWSASGSPGRIIALFILAACVLGGSVATQNIELTKRQFLGLCAAGIILVGITINVAMQTVSPPEGIEPGVWLAVTRVALQTNLTYLLIYAAVPVILYILIQRRLYWPIALIAPLLALHVVNMGTVRSGLAGSFKPSDRLTTARTAFINDSWELNGAAKALMPPNTATLVRMPDIAGYDSLLAKGTVDLLKQVNGKDPAPVANGNMMFTKPTADPLKLADCGVSEVWSLNPIPGWTPTTRDERGICRYVLKGKGRAYTPQGSAIITLDGLDRQTVVAQGPGKLTVKDRNFPGWHATIDGKSQEVTGELWREVELASGKHTVEFRYDPPGMKLGFIAGFLGWLLCLGLTILGRSRIEISRYE
jgi:hypothetical protein